MRFGSKRWTGQFVEEVCKVVWMVDIDDRMVAEEW